MPITRTAWIDDDGSGTTGTIINNAEKTTLYNQIDAALAPSAGYGVWYDIPFNAGLFTSTPGSWTVGAGNLITVSYMLMAKTLWLTVIVSSTTVAGSPTRLRYTLPGGLTVAKTGVMPFNLYDGAAGSGVGYATAPATATYVDFMRDLVGTPWGNGPTHVHAGNLIINVV